MAEVLQLIMATASPEMKALLRDIGPELKLPEYRHRMNSIDSCSSEDEEEPQPQQQQQHEQEALAAASASSASSASSSSAALGGVGAGGDGAVERRRPPPASIPEERAIEAASGAALALARAAAAPAVDPPLPEQSLLHELVGIDRADRISRQLRRGASVHAEDSMGETPLFWAVSGQVVDLLVAEGADVHWRNNVCGCSAFGKFACQGKHEPLRALARHLRKAGRLEEYVNEPASHTLRTPLHAAACNGFLETVRELLDLRADPAAKDSLGLTPLDLARRRGFAEVEALLDR